MGRSVSGFPTVASAVEAASEGDHGEFERVRRHSLLSSADERISKSRSDVEGLAGNMGTNLHTGLTKEQVFQKLERYGPNLLDKSKAKPFWRILLEQINVLNMLVFAAALLCIFQGNLEWLGIEEDADYMNAGMLIFIVVSCMCVGAYMEWTCSRIMADVSALSAPTCKVLRDGEQMQIDNSEVVPGDVVLLGLGEVVPADCIIIEVTDLLTNEMALTGEPHDITKTRVPEDPTSPFPSNMLYATSNVVNGSGRGLVLKTGMMTEIGKIAQHLKMEEVGLTPVQQTMNTIGNIVTVAMVVLVGIIFCISYFKRVNDPTDPCDKTKSACFLGKSLKRALFNAVGAIPETLQPAAMFLLVMGCNQMQKVKAATRKLSAVDTLGTCSFICSDKTGTLTEGKMTALTLIPRISGAEPRFDFWPTRGFDPKGGIFNSGALTPAAKAAIEEKADKGGNLNEVLPNLGDPKNDSMDAKLARSCVVAVYLNSYNTTLLQKTGGVWHIDGNMSEGALVVAAAKAGLRDDKIRFDYPRIAELEVPFSSARKTMATVHTLPADGTFESIKFRDDCAKVAITKGAPDVLLKKLTHVLTVKDGKYVPAQEEFSEADKTWFNEENAKLSSMALRVLCVCLTPLSSECARRLEGCSGSDERIDAIMAEPTMLLCILGLMDPPRQSAKVAIQLCNQAGIRVAMITGDQKPTAIAIARELGILRSDQGDEAAAECAVLKSVEGNQEAVNALCGKVVVWARAQPSDKVTIVDSLQKQGHKVAMTGDGVNDAGALKYADVGVAMGIAGTEVAKGASDLILLDDRFATIVDAIAEGRRIFNNIQKMVAYLLCVNVLEVVVIFLAMVLGWAVPLEDMQLLKANFVTHEFYPWVMVMEPAGFFNMMQPPRTRDKPLIPGLTRNVLMVSVLIWYCSMMLLSQFVGSKMYMGTVYLDVMTGADSVTEFYSGQGYSCLFAHTRQKNNDGEYELKRDLNPIYCHMCRFSILQEDCHSEFGRSHKSEQQEFIESDRFHWTTGRSDGFFDVAFSFLNSTCAGKSDACFKTSNTDFATKQNLLEFCNDKGDPLFRRSPNEIADGYDHLCWAKTGRKDGTPEEYDESELAWDKVYPKDLAGEQEEEGKEDPARKPTLYAKWNCLAWGSRKARSMILLTMVLMEFFMLYGFSKYELGVQFDVLMSNKWFPIAWCPMMCLLLWYVYFPVNKVDNEFAPLGIFGLLLCCLMACSFYVIFEGAKVLHRRWFEQELREKRAVAAMAAEGRLGAFTGRDAAFGQYPNRHPLLEMEMQNRGAEP